MQQMFSSHDWPDADCIKILSGVKEAIRTNDCPNPMERCCVSCRSNDHASWSRECPTFIRKLSDFNERNPENALQYIPTADPWTWTASTHSTQQARPNLPPSSQPTFTRERSQPAKKTQMPPRRMDSYVPEYDSYIPSYDRRGVRTQGSNRTGQDNIPRDLADSRPLTIVLKGPVLSTACGPETGPNWTETDRTFGPGPNEPVLNG